MKVVANATVTPETVQVTVSISTPVVHVIETCVTWVYQQYLTIYEPEAFVIARAPPLTSVQPRASKGRASALPFAMCEVAA